MFYNPAKVAEKAAALNLDQVIGTLTMYQPRTIRKALTLIYTRLTNYILLDLGEDDLCSNEEKLPEAMEILRELIDSIDEMEDSSSRQLSVINTGDGAEQEN